MNKLKKVILGIILFIVGSAIWFLGFAYCKAYYNEWKLKDYDFAVDYSFRADPKVIYSLLKENGIKCVINNKGFIGYNKEDEQDADRLVYEFLNPELDHRPNMFVYDAEMNRELKSKLNEANIEYERIEIENGYEYRWEMKYDELVTAITDNARQKVFNIK